MAAVLLCVAANCINPLQVLPSLLHDTVWLSYFHYVSLQLWALNKVFCKLMPPFFLEYCLQFFFSLSSSLRWLIRMFNSLWKNLPCFDIRKIHALQTHYMPYPELLLMDNKNKDSCVNVNVDGILLHVKSGFAHISSTSVSKQVGSLLMYQLLYEFQNPWPLFFKYDPCKGKCFRAD